MSDFPGRATETPGAPIRWHGVEEVDGEPRPDARVAATGDGAPSGNGSAAAVDATPVSADGEIDLVAEERVESARERADPDAVDALVPEDRDFDDDADFELRPAEREAVDLDRFFSSLRAAVRSNGLPGAALRPDRAPDSAAGGVAGSSLEADVDQWRRRAVIWRERALASDALAKALQQNVDDLRVMLDDFREFTRGLLSDDRDAVAAESTEHASKPALGAPADVNSAGVTEADLPVRRRRRLFRRRRTGPPEGA